MSGRKLHRWTSNLSGLGRARVPTPLRGPEEALWGWSLENLARVGSWTVFPKGKAETFSFEFLARSVACWWP